MVDVPNWVLLALILTEWAYVVWWTRTAGTRITSGVLRAVGGLRAGRGKAPTAAESLAAAAAAGPEGPTPGSVGIPDDLVVKAAKAFGVPVEQARAMAAQFAATGEIPPEAEMGGILQRFLEGKLTAEDKSKGLNLLWSEFLKGNQGQGAAAQQLAAASAGLPAVSGWV